jgi:Bacterial Ig domain
MTIEFAKHGMKELRQSARLPVQPPMTRLDITGFEGSSLSFATIDLLTEVRIPIHPSYTTGFASGPASVGGSNGRGSESRTANYCRVVRGYFVKIISVGAMLLCADSGAIANNDAGLEPAPLNIHQQADAKMPAPATVRIVAMNDEHSRARFGASGLPAGLSIDPQTGVISGAIDREANRNDGAPFVVRVLLKNGASASGVSILNLKIENNDPVATDDILKNPQSSAPLNVLANDADPDGDRLIVIVASAPRGTVAFTTGGIVNYAPNSAEVQNDIITYHVSDGHGGAAAAKVSVQIK